MSDEPRMIAVVRQNCAAPDGQSVDTVLTKVFGPTTTVAEMWLWYARLGGSYSVTGPLMLTRETD